VVDQPIAEPVNREVLDKRRSLRNASGNLLDIHRRLTAGSHRENLTETLNMWRPETGVH